jgi:sugar phosphate isomerase/epimerase
MPRELLDNSSRVIPGDGVSALNGMLRKLAGTGYAGPLSVELKRWCGGVPDADWRGSLARYCRFRLALSTMDISGRVG